MHAFLLLLTLAAEAMPGVAPEAADGHVSAEFTPASLVLVRVHVNGKGPHHFVIDTGATTTMLDAELATELRLRGTGVMEVVTSGGTFRAPTGTLDELSVGGARFSSLGVSWMPLDEVRRGDRRIAGIIGQDVLGRRSLVIDYERRRVELTTKPCGSDDAAVDVAWSEGRPMVRAGVRGLGLTQPARLVLDSAANALILFTPRRSGRGLTSVSTHQATTTAEVVPKVRVEIEGIRREGLAVLIAPTAARAETGLLPTAWFSRICIDAPRSRATLRVRPW
jgi:predicted aspartyl protease